MFALRQLSRASLLHFAEALESGRLLPPFTPMKLAPYVPAAMVVQVAEVMAGLAGAGMQPRHVAQLARVLAEERAASQELANFTEAAHQRNIEAGVRLDDSQIAQALRIQFETLRERGLLRPVPGLPGVAM